MEELHSPEKALGKNFEELSLIYEFWRIPDFVDHEKYKSKFMKKLSHLSKIGLFFFHFCITEKIQRREACRKFNLILARKFIYKVGFFEIFQNLTFLTLRKYFLTKSIFMVNRMKIRIFVHCEVAINCPRFTIYASIR